MNLSGKTVLVTGASGFVGKHVVRQLRDHSEAKVVALSRQSEPDVRGENVKQVVCSFNDLSPDIWEKKGIEEIDAVIHLGGFAPRCGQDANRIDEVYRDNLLGTKTLFESLPPTVKRIVFSSTLDVYDYSSTHAIDENSPIRPETLYAASKYFCELLVKSFALARDWKYSILRMGHLYGPGEGRYMKLIPQTIRMLLRGEAPMIFGPGTDERDYLYVEDAVEFVIRAATSEIKHLGPLNIVRGRSFSVQEIVETLMRLTYFEEPPHHAEAASDSRSLRFDNSNMLKLLGDATFVELEEGLRREIAYFQRLTE